MLTDIGHALDSLAADPVVSCSEHRFPSLFDVSGLASASVGSAAAEVAELIRCAGGSPGVVQVNTELASQWFSSTIEPLDFQLPPLFDPLFGDYECADGWIRLHTNSPAHREAALTVLGAGLEREDVGRAVSSWRGAELEKAVVETGGCAAAMMTVEEWEHHPAGEAVAGEPLIVWSGDPAPWQPQETASPLGGLRVLDLTRVLAGPVCTRFLGGWGAEVMRIDPPGWDEPGLAPEVTLGKRCVRLDLLSEREVFVDLLADADVVVHGYRPGALEGLGVGPFDGVVDVALDAYGWSGPWAGRRGFDSLVQMSCGIAAAGMQWYRSDIPRPLPVQALDHATGYLMAAAVARALRGGPSRARLSLAKTAGLLMASEGEPEARFDVIADSVVEDTEWGTLNRAVPPVTIGGRSMAWDLPACSLGSHDAGWYSS